MVSETTKLFSEHSRKFAGNRFVYPVVSRRSGGISLGVNLNPDKVCNFDCIYCQVDRSEQGETRFVEMDTLLSELDQMISWITSQEIFESDKFSKTPLSWRKLQDIAFSGDGEPTTYKNFDQIISACAEVKRRHALSEVKMVLITNASMFHRSHVQRGLEILDANSGEIWAKLEAGTEQFFQKIERTPIPFQQILDNIKAAAKVRPLVIQSMFMLLDQEPPPHCEIEAFCDRLCEIAESGGKIRRVQVYTVARRPAESNVAPLKDSQVDSLVRLIQKRTNLEVSGFYGTTH